MPPCEGVERPEMDGVARPEMDGVTRPEMDGVARPDSEGVARPLSRTELRDEATEGGRGAMPGPTVGCDSFENCRNRPHWGAHEK